MPTILQNNQRSGVAASNRFLEDGSYFKLRNASLTYSFGNIGNYIKNLNVYVAGSNLFVITGFSGFDPEVNIDKQTEDILPVQLNIYLIQLQRVL